MITKRYYISISTGYEDHDVVVTEGVLQKEMTSAGMLMLIYKMLFSIRAFERHQRSLSA